MTALGESADALEQAAVREKPYYSKTEAAQLLNVSRPTLDKWLSSGILPLQRVPERQRLGIPTAALLALASEVEELRELGQDRGILAAALSRLQQDTPESGQGFAAQLRSGTRDDEYVSAAPGPDWDPNDEWDVNALNFDEKD